MLVTIFRSIRVLFLGILISGSCLAEVHWPGLMGPDRNGWAADFMAPEKWPEKLQRKWQVEVGTGYATPIVSKGFVYQHGREGDSEVVRCIELNSGDVRWKKSYAVPFKMGGGGERHGKGPKSCPVLADGRLFTMSITGVLSAWDIESGERLWYRDYSAKFKKGHPYWGTATSPIVDQDRVFVHFGTDDEGRLVALDTKRATRFGRMEKRSVLFVTSRGQTAWCFAASGMEP